MKMLRLTLLLLALSPATSFSQWNMVLFDSLNVFNHAFTATPSTVMLTGLDMTGGSFFMRTNNGGLQWDSIAINSAGSTYEIRSLFFTDASIGYAGGYHNNLQSLLKTTDNGNTWTDVAPDPSNVNAVSSVFFLDPLNGFAAAGDVLHKTTDGGLSWTSHTTPINISSIAFYDVSNGMACGSVNGMAAAVKTNDGGLTWSTVFAPANIFGNLMKIDVVGAGEYWTSLEYTNMLYRTTNGGSSWDSIPVSPVFDMLQDFDFLGVSQGRVLTWMGEIYFTSDGGTTWTMEYATSQGAYGPTVFLYSISFSGTTGYVAGSNGLVKKLTDETTGFTESQINSGFSIYPNPSRTNVVVRSEDIGAYMKITNSEGKLISSQLLQHEKTVIDLNNWPAGIYMVILTNEHGTAAGKLIVSGE